MIRNRDRFDLAASCVAASFPPRRQTLYRDERSRLWPQAQAWAVQIPLSFWKIAVQQKTDSTIAAAALIIGQTEYVHALYEAKVFSGLRPYTIDEMRSRKI